MNQPYVAHISMYVYVLTVLVQGAEWPFLMKHQPDGKVIHEKSVLE